MERSSSLADFLRSGTPRSREDSHSPRNTQQHRYAPDNQNTQQRLYTTHPRTPVLLVSYPSRTLDRAQLESSLLWEWYFVPVTLIPAPPTFFPDASLPAQSPSQSALPSYSPPVSSSPSQPQSPPRLSCCLSRPGHYAHGAPWAARPFLDFHIPGGVSSPSSQLGLGRTEPS